MEIQPEFKPQAATLIVAASDSLHPERADYYCDGTDDDVQIQAAIDALLATGGKIVLLEGEYNFTSDLIINNATIMGQSVDTTIINLAASITIYITEVGKLHNATINIEDTHNSNVIELYELYEQLKVLNNINIMKTGDTIQATAIYFDSDSTSAGERRRCQSNSFGDIFIKGKFEYGVLIDVVENTGDVGANFTANNFSLLWIEYPKYPFSIISTGTDTPVTQGNHFKSIQIQPIASCTSRGMYLSGTYVNYNIFDSVMCWDWGVAYGSSLTILNATNNIFMGNFPLHTDIGYKNTIIENIPPNQVAVRSKQGNYAKLSDALTAIVDASDTNRYVIHIYGKVDESENIVAKSHIDIVGHNATINFDIDKYLLINVANTTWKDIDITGEHNTLVLTAIGADETSILNNVNVLNNESTYAYAKAIEIAYASSPKLIDCTGKTPNSQSGFEIGHSASPQLIRCTGQSNIYAFLFTSDFSSVLECTAVDSSIYIGGNSSAILKGCVSKFSETAINWDYLSANNGRFRPFSGDPYMLTACVVYVTNANVGITLKLGTSIGGSEIADNIDIGTTGNKNIVFNRVSVVSDGYIYATPSGVISNSDISIRYGVILNNALGNRSIKIDTSGYAIIDDCLFQANEATSAVLEIATDYKNWQMNNCHIESLDPTNKQAIYASATKTLVPIKNCTVVGLISANISSFVPESYGKYIDLLMDVLAVSATYIRSNEDLSVATPITFTLDAQPDVPRTLSWSFDSHAQITEYDMEVIGIDAKGNTITETWDETAGWSGETSNAFATITSIKMTSRTGTGAADTMDLGITDVLGLSNVIYATSDVFKIKKNNANATVATAQVNTTYDTYDMSVIGLNVGDDFTIWYKSNLNIIS